MTDEPTSEPPEAGAESAPPPPYAPSEAVSGIAESESGPPTEVLVGAAFAGGVALALILRRLTS